MSEEKRKPTNRWFSNRRAIFAWRFIIFCIIIAGVIYIAATQDQFGSDRITWDDRTAPIQNAVKQYQSEHNGMLPIFNTTYSNANCSNCSVIDISALLTVNGGTLRVAPDGLNLSASGNDNCGGNASLRCNNYSSYIWIVDKKGEVYSYCAGTGCETNNSGYQGVWP